jgi:hypothetical protein
MTSGMEMEESSMGGDDTPSPLHPRGTGGYHGVVGSTAMTVYYRMMASTPHLTKQPNHPTYPSLSWFPPSQYAR